MVYYHEAHALSQVRPTGRTVADQELPNPVPPIQLMTNVTKWFVAIPFAALVSLVIPALIAGDPRWFLGHWTDTLYVSLSAGMWLIATAFVDLSRPRGSPDLANLLLPLGLILSVPITVWDRVFWTAATLPFIINLFGMLTGLAAAVLGIESRRYLGRAYSPRADHSDGSSLVRDGPYRWIRHPIYLAAILWVAGWPLTIASFLGSLSALAFVLPAIYRRVQAEEDDLARTYGDEYEQYRQTTWRLIPYLY